MFGSTRKRRFFFGLGLGLGWAKLSVSIGSWLIESCVGRNMNMDMIDECSLNEGKEVKLHGC